MTGPMRGCQPADHISIRIGRASVIGVVLCLVAAVCYAAGWYARS
jgi:drug/metabolite transporter (DMT)-like permease